MTYKPTGIYQPAGRVLTEEEYNAFLAAHGEQDHPSIRDLEHKINLLELRNDSIAFYMRYVIDDILEFADNTDLEQGDYFKIMRIALEAKRVMAKLQNNVREENRICERIDRGVWLYAADRWVRAINGDTAMLKHYTTEDSDPIDIKADVLEIARDGKMVSVEYATGNDSENAKEWQRWVYVNELTGWREND